MNRALPVDTVENVASDRVGCVVRHADAHTVEGGDSFERQRGEVGTAGVLVRRRVDVGAGVGYQLDATDVELRARRVAGRDSSRDMWSSITGPGNPG